jgi:hypothetical protein
MSKLSEGKCRDCGRVCQVEYREWSRASGPRCSGCGGLLDKQGGRVPHRRTPKGKIVR